MAILECTCCSCCLSIDGAIDGAIALYRVCIAPIAQVVCAAARALACALAVFSALPVVSRPVSCANGHPLGILNHHLIQAHAAQGLRAAEELSSLRNEIAKA